MYTIDLHVHTAESSYCGRLSAWEIVKRYAEAGYQGIVITDHYNEGFFKRFPNMSWSEKMDQFLVGYRTAYTLGKRVGLDVYLGLEYRDTSCQNDYIILGLDEKFLYENPELYLVGIAEASKRFREAGAFVDQVHPCRPGVCFLADPSLLDGMEVYNGSAQWRYDRVEARRLSAEHHLIPLSGSDTHLAEEVGHGGLILENSISSTQQLITEIRAGRYELIEKEFVSSMPIRNA